VVSRAEKSIHFYDFRVYQELERGYLFATGGPVFASGGNTTETVVSTSTDTPLINLGLNRHCSTASIADFMRLVGPETHRALSTAPLLPMTTRRTTVPSTKCEAQRCARSIQKALLSAWCCYTSPRLSQTLPR